MLIFSQTHVYCDNKAAYATYLEAHGIIIHILSSKVVFKDKGIFLLPLFALQEGRLRHLKDE